MMNVSGNSSDSQLIALKRELTNTVNEARKDDPASIEELVRMLSLIMTNVTNKPVSNKQINYVCSMLSDSEEKVILGIGEGKSGANALLVAAQSLLGEPVEMVYESSSLMQRDMEDFQSFFENLPIPVPVVTTVAMIGDNMPDSEDDMSDLEDESFSSSKTP